MHLKIFVVLVVAALSAAQRKYYSLEDMPDTNFDCRDKILGGYYADPEANCQMFHVCVKIPGQGVQDFRFLCPNETVFDQENQICADSGDIDCETSGLYLENFDLYRIGSAQSKRPVPQIGGNKGGIVPLGPSTKSPILTNNVYEDDDFYLQKSETGDRRLHSKDLLRGSSSSNFFNNRNKGKDLEEDDEETQPKTNNNNNNNNQFRPRPNAPLRPKTQYQSQFRKAETQAPSTTTQQPVVGNQNQLNQQKRTKIAVRKLTRKRPEEEGEGQTQQTQQPQQQQQSFPSYTTQVTQKFGGDANRYSTFNRPSTTPASTFGTSTAYNQQSQQQQQTQHARFPNSKRVEQSTPAFFEASTTTGSSAQSSNAGVKDTTPFSLLRNPIVAAGPSYNANQNRGSTGFQQNRPTTSNYSQQPSNGNYPSPTPNYQGQQQQQQQQFNRQNNVGSNTNYQQQTQQNRQSNFGTNNYQQQTQQQNRQQSNFGATNYQQQTQQQQQQQQSNFGATNYEQQNRQNNAGSSGFQQQNRQTAATAANGFTQQRQNNYQQQDAGNSGNFQQGRQQYNTNANSNFQAQQNGQQTQVTNGNYQQQNRQQTQVTNGNFQQQSRQQTQVTNGNYQQQNRQQTQVTNGNFQQQNRQQVAQVTNGNYQQQNKQQTTQANGNTQQQAYQQNTANNYQQQSRQQSSAAGANFQQQTRQQQTVADNVSYQQNKQVTTGALNQGRAQIGQQTYTNTQQGFNNQQTYNAQQGFNNQQTTYNAQQNFNNQGHRQTGQRQSFNRNYEDFDEGDNQEFLKTAPTNNFRPSDINSLTNANYKTETRTGNSNFNSSTTKYITPTIVTTPRTTPAYDTPPARQSYQQSTAQPSNYYTPTVSTTQRVQQQQQQQQQQQKAVTTTLSPSSKSPQRIYPSPTPSKTSETKDVAYDYAYYDDSSASFPDYGGFDAESDFSRTVQRTKSRLI